MVIESKEWVKVYHRTTKNKSGGVFVYVDSDTLRFSGIPTDQELEVKRYHTEKGKVILQFRVKQ